MTTTGHISDTSLDVAADLVTCHLHAATLAAAAEAAAGYIADAARRLAAGW